MTHTLEQDGFETHAGILSSTELHELREEANRIAASEGTVCVRGLLEKSRVFKRLSVSAHLQSLLPDGLQPVRSILFDKTPDQNWPVLWHQDLTIAVQGKHAVPEYGPWSIKDGVPHTQPPSSLLESMVTLRLHLDDTDGEKGALLVVPGSHHLGKIPPTDVPRYTHAVPHVCNCRAGDVLVMSPLILHSSRRSKNPGRRRVLHFEYAPPEALHANLQWHEYI